MKRLLVLLGCSARILLGWGCEGHQIVALIAEKNLNPRAAAEVRNLLTSNPIDPELIRFCTEGHEDPMSDASTWADDIRRSAKTGKWHYMDIPLEVTSGDPNKYCEPVGKADAKGERDGCVLSALLYNRDVLQDEHKTLAERAEALRYIIHFVGDMHQPLHVTDNHDQGGNCAPMSLLDAVTISNLHSIWDSGLLEKRLKKARQEPEQFAAALNRKFASDRTAWTKDMNPGRWVWEIHEAGVETTYGALQPAIPLQPVNRRTDCNAESATVWKLHIRLGPDYEKAAGPVIDQQLAKAGFRLAAFLNEIWP
jgi:hypothetical protein